MAEIRELVLTFLERLSHNALPKNRKRETLDACILRQFLADKTDNLGLFYIDHCHFQKSLSRRLTET